MLEVFQLTRSDDQARGLPAYGEELQVLPRGRIDVAGGDDATGGERVSDTQGPNARGTRSGNRNEGKTAVVVSAADTFGVEEVSGVHVPAGVHSGEPTRWDADREETGYAAESGLQTDAADPETRRHRSEEAWNTIEGNTGDAKLPKAMVHD